MVFKRCSWENRIRTCTSRTFRVLLALSVGVATPFGSADPEPAALAKDPQTENSPIELEVGTTDLPNNVYNLTSNGPGEATSDIFLIEVNLEEKALEVVELDVLKTVSRIEDNVNQREDQQSRPPIEMGSGARVALNLWMSGLGRVLRSPLPFTNSKSLERPKVFHLAINLTRSATHFYIQYVIVPLLVTQNPNIDPEVAKDIAFKTALSVSIASFGFGSFYESIGKLMGYTGFWSQDWMPKSVRDKIIASHQTLNELREKKKKGLRLSAEQQLQFKKLDNADKSWIVTQLGERGDAASVAPVVTRTDRFLDFFARKVALRSPSNGLGERLPVQAESVKTGFLKFFYMEFAFILGSITAGQGLWSVLAGGNEAVTAISAATALGAVAWASLLGTATQGAGDKVNYGVSQYIVPDRIARTVIPENLNAEEAREAMRDGHRALTVGRGAILSVSVTFFMMLIAQGGGHGGDSLWSTVTLALTGVALTAASMKIQYGNIVGTIKHDIAKFKAKFARRENKAKATVSMMDFLHELPELKEMPADTLRSVSLFDQDKMFLVGGNPCSLHF